MPDCPIPLLGRDLLSKLRAQFFEPDEDVTVEFLDPLEKVPAVKGIYILTRPLLEEWRMFQSTIICPVVSEEWTVAVPGVWAEDNPPGLAINHTPIWVELIPWAWAVRERQYPIPRAVVGGIQ